MDPRLIVAAQTGNVNELRSLMGDDPFLLKPAELTGGENPLHIACKGGHVDFVKEILFHNPEFAEELNADGFSPLHIASAYGYLDIVKEFLFQVGPHLCFVKAKNTKTALHYAVINGQIQVIGELVSGACLPSIKQVTDDGETCFHMAVKHKRMEALEHLTQCVDSLPFGDAMFVLNRRNKQGNTILHLAASRNQQDKVLGHLLLTVPRYLELNALNMWDLTPLDVFQTEGGRREMEERLTKAGARRGADLKVWWRRMFDYGNKIGNMGKKYTMSIETRNTLLVVLALIIASTYQAVIAPPGGLWQDSVILDANLDTIPDAMPIRNRSITNSTDVPHIAGTSIFRTLDPLGFTFFFIFNTVGFMISCALSLYLIAPNDLVIWLALVPMFVTYSISAGVVVSSTGKAWMIIIVCAVVIPSVITQRHFFSYQKSKIGSTFGPGRYLYRVIYYRLFKTQPNSTLFRL